MIEVDEIEKDTPLWAVSHAIEEMIYPTQVKYLSRESSKGKKLAFVNMKQKRVCYPSHLLFTSKIDAEIYGSVNFLKMYYSFDPFTISTEIPEETLLDANELVEKYSETEPDKYLYYWMGNVPNR